MNKPAFSEKLTVGDGETSDWLRLFVKRTGNAYLKKIGSEIGIAVLIPQGTARLEYVYEDPDTPGVTVFTWPAGDVSQNIQVPFQTTPFAVRLVSVSGTAELIINGD